MFIFAPLLSFVKVIFKTLMLNKFIIIIYLVFFCYHFNRFWLILFLWCLLNYLSLTISYFTIIFCLFGCFKNLTSSISQIGSVFYSFFFFFLSFLFKLFLWYEFLFLRDCSHCYSLICNMNHISIFQINSLTWHFICVLGIDRLFICLISKYLQLFNVNS